MERRTLVWLWPTAALWTPWTTRSARAARTSITQPGGSILHVARANSGCRSRRAWRPATIPTTDYAVGLILLFGSRLHCRCSCRSLYRRSRQSYADNAGDCARTPDPRSRWSQFRALLAHYPLLNFFGTAVYRSPPDRATHRVLAFAFSLGCSIALAHLIEQRKAVLKRALRSALDLIHGNPRAAFDRQRLS
jgi:hypothetical protein